MPEAVRSMEVLGRIPTKSCVELVAHINSGARAQVVCRLKQRREFYLGKRLPAVCERREADFVPLLPSSGPILIEHRPHECLMLTLVGEGGQSL